MISVLLKENDEIIEIKNDNNLTASQLLDVLNYNAYVRIYNYIFNCNEIVSIFVEEEGTKWNIN